MGLGAVLGANYKLPASVGGLQPQGQAVQAAPSQGSPGTDALEHVTGLTDEYYRNWGDVEAFATNLWENFGIDVTKPDFRKPEAMEAHKAYTKAIANLRIQKNRLSGGQKALEQYQKGIQSAQGPDLRYTGDPNQPFNIMDIENIGITKEELQTQRDVAAMERTKYSQGQANWRANLKGDKEVKKYTGYYTELAGIANVLSGNAEWAVADDTLGKDGQALLQTNFKSGMKYGKNAENKDNIIDRILLNPEDGSMRFQFKDGTFEDIDRSDLRGVTAKLISNNSGMRMNDQKLNAFFEETQSESFDPYNTNSYLPEGFEDPTAALQGVGEQATAAYSSTIAAVKGKLSDLIRGGTGEDFTMPDGTKIDIKRKALGTDKFKVRNWSDVENGYGGSGDDMTEQDIIDFLVWSGMLTNIGAAPEVRETEGLSDDEKKAQELIKKYGG
ncbi:hypothetical protein LCGC14_0667840 [marine sediment metagenome]|uniref:Uncharacterized protein n=1 Tax=marine sediment metagenome TaxID=412755 RepID=A0A0F9QRT9_9ZZZZ